MAGPGQCTGESQWQDLNPINQVVEVGPGVDVGYPLRSARSDNKRSASPRESVGAKTTRPEGPLEFVPVEISSTIRIPSQTIELSSQFTRSLFVCYWIVDRPAIILVTKLRKTSIQLWMKKRDMNSWPWRMDQNCKPRDTSLFDCGAVIIIVRWSPGYFPKYISIPWLKQ